MIGVDPLNAGSAIFQATFSVALHVVGRLRSGLTPSRVGPRQFGQLSAANTVAPASAVATHIAIKVLRIVGLLGYPDDSATSGRAVNPAGRRWRFRRTSAG